MINDNFCYGFGETFVEAHLVQYARMRPHTLEVENAEDLHICLQFIVVAIKQSTS